MHAGKLGCDKGSVFLTATSLNIPLFVAILLRKAQFYSFVCMKFLPLNYFSFPKVESLHWSDVGALSTWLLKFQVHSPIEDNLCSCFRVSKGHKQRPHSKFRGSPLNILTHSSIRSISSHFPALPHWPPNM